MLISLAYMINFSVFSEIVSDTAEVEFHVISQTFVVKIFHPFIVKDTVAVIVFAVHKNFVYLSCGEIFFQSNRACHGSAHDILLCERKIQKYRDSFVRTLLILRSKAHTHIIPAISPV